MLDLPTMATILIHTNITSPCWLSFTWPYTQVLNVNLDSSLNIIMRGVFFLYCGCDRSRLCFCNRKCARVCVRCWFSATIWVILSCTQRLFAQASPPIINHVEKSIELLEFMWVWVFSFEMICCRWETGVQQFRGTIYFLQIAHWQAGTLGKRKSQLLIETESNVRKLIYYKTRNKHLINPVTQSASYLIQEFLRPLHDRFF